MKTLFVIFSFILILLMGGCKESQINQPDLTFDQDYNKTTPITHTTTIQPLQQQIKLCCDTYDPVSGDCKIVGKVTYIHNATPYGNGLIRVDLKIELDAELCTGFMNCFKYSIYGNSSDMVLVNLTGSKALEKNYPINFRPDLRLGVLYKVTATGLGVAKICLHQIDQVSYLDHDKQ